MTPQFAPTTWRRWLRVGVVAVVILTLLATANTGGAAPMAGDRTLNATEVARLFDGALPALATRSSVPAITGSRAADRQIAAVALSRGYRYRGSPADGLGTYQGRRLQQRAIDDLRDLQTAMADEAGVTLTLTSGHRGIASQRRIFRSRLTSNSLALRGRVVTNREIAQGLADDVLAAVMSTAAPPGFSKHHTGFAIDVSSSGLGGFSFRRSRAFAWLTENRYANAMRFGWIPSYPDGATQQGPQPEPWGVGVDRA